VVKSYISSKLTENLSVLRISNRDNEEANKSFISVLAWELNNSQARKKHRLKMFLNWLLGT